MGEPESIVDGRVLFLVIHVSVVYSMTRTPHQNTVRTDAAPRMPATTGTLCSPGKRYVTRACDSRCDRSSGKVEENQTSCPFDPVKRVNEPTIEMCEDDPNTMLTININVANQLICGG